MRLGLVVILVIASLLSTRAIVSPALAVSHGARADGGYTVYLPAIFKPPCTDFSASLYSAASTPVLTTGNVVTVTGVLVNDGCARLGAPWFSVYADPTTTLTITNSHNGYFLSVLPGNYLETKFVFHAAGDGPATVTMQVQYEVLAEGLPPGAQDARVASPLLIRVLPVP